MELVSLEKDTKEERAFAVKFYLSTKKGKNHYEVESFYEVPTTMQQFTRDWNAIHFHEHLRYRYLSSIEPSNLSTIFKDLFD